MKIHSFRFALLLLTLTVLACSLTGGPSGAATQAVTNAPPATASETPTLIPSGTPSLTLAAPTASATAQSFVRTAIPSPTPSFDAASAVRLTPEPPAACPPTNPAGAPPIDFLNFTPEFRLSDQIELVEKRSLDYLNSFGPEPILQNLRASGKPEGKTFFFQDVTNDGVPELGFAVRDMFIFGCVDGAYTTLLSVKATAALSAPEVFALKDMNLDGLPEVAIKQYSCGANNDCLEVSLYEWTDAGFDSLIQNVDSQSVAAMSGGAQSNPVPQADLFDTDVNGTLELVVYGGIPRDPIEFANDGPWREAADVYMWNGDRFAWARRTFTSPQFRFQAVQDADDAALFGRFEQAEAFYRSVTTNPSLEFWSPDRAAEVIEQQLNALSGIVPTVTATPVPENRSEFFQLGAYASYRLIVLYSRFGRIGQAEAEYASLLANFPPDNPGFDYTGLATQFWDDFEANGNISQACGLAVEYARQHQNLLAPLGSTFHGVQSRIYAPADVCPFG